MPSHTVNPDSLDAATVQNLCLGVLPVWHRHLDAARQHSDVGMAELLLRFSQLRLLLRDGANGASDEVGAIMDNVLTALQFHDRVSQMLQIIQDDLVRMQEANAPGASIPPLDAKAWLERLESFYVMSEQHDCHGESLDDGPTPDSTTYF